MSAGIGAIRPSKSLIFGRIGTGAPDGRLRGPRAAPGASRSKEWRQDREAGEYLLDPRCGSLQYFRGDRSDRRQLNQRAATGWWRKSGSEILREAAAILDLILVPVPGTGFAAATVRGSWPSAVVAAMPTGGGLVVNLVVLAALVVTGVAVVMGLRRGWFGFEGFGGDGFGGFGGSGGAGRGDWEKTLMKCKNLRDEGVLSEEEFRKIRTLVEPHARTGGPELRARQRSPQDPVGPEAGRE